MSLILFLRFGNTHYDVSCGEACKETYFNFVLSMLQSVDLIQLFAMYELGKKA
jgi:hypothetical protein